MDIVGLRTQLAFTTELKNYRKDESKDELKGIRLSVTNPQDLLMPCKMQSKQYFDLNSEENFYGVDVRYLSNKVNDLDIPLSDTVGGSCG
ncbi:MAG: hypothetical protein LW832_02885 [Parachlamydia sp.]|jgi:hypothetical protein|nr:hypothetical protein [Parachlamydia sp.]